MKERGPKVEQPIPSIGTINERLNGYGVPYVFVGGAVSARVGPDTTLGRVNTVSQTFSLDHAKQYNTKRADGTVRDVDVISFCEDPVMFRVMEEDMRRAFPDVPISIEPMHYPHWPKRSKLKQFVVGNDVNPDGSIDFVFDDLRQTMPSEAFDVWRLQTDEGDMLPVFNPATHAMRYLVRVPSGLKPKDDGEKLASLMRLADEFAQRIGELDPVKDDVYFTAIYEPWLSFIAACQEVPAYRLTGIKTRIDRLFWNTIGEAMGNGRGPIGKLTAKLGSKFSG